MSSEAETQQPPQPDVEERPSSPATATTAGDKKVIGKYPGYDFSYRPGNRVYFPNYGFHPFVKIEGTLNFMPIRR